MINDDPSSNLHATPEGSLPAPGHQQAYWDVSALEAGHLIVPCKLFVTGVPDDEVREAPALSFLLRHSASGTTFVVDLGIRKDVATASPPMVRERALKLFTCEVPQDAPESLAKGGLRAEDVQYVCLTHMHWDHIGDTRPFTRARFVVGEGSRGLLKPGWPEDPESKFPSDLLPEERTDYISHETGTGEDAKKWTSVGPFPHACDFFGDGSLYIVDAPGHLPGHVNVLARTSTDGAWIYLAGDSAHDWRLIHGEGDIATERDDCGHITFCMHVDIEQAKENIKRIVTLLQQPRVRVILAHDAEWYAQNKGESAFWPGNIPSL